MTKAQFMAWTGALVLLTIAGRPASGYELATHAALTREALVASRLFPTAGR